MKYSGFACVHDVVYAVPSQTTPSYFGPSHFVRTDPWVIAQKGWRLQAERADERGTMIEVALLFWQKKAQLGYT